MYGGLTSIYIKLNKEHINIITLVPYNNRIQ